MALLGRLVEVGLMGGGQVEVDLRQLMAKRLQVCGTGLRGRSIEEKLAVTAKFERHVLPHLASGSMKPVVDAEAYPEAGPPWRPGKLYSVAQIDDGGWEKLVPKFIAAGFDMYWMERRPRRSRGPGTETPRWR